MLVSLPCGCSLETAGPTVVFDACHLHRGRVETAGDSIKQKHRRCGVVDAGEDPCIGIPVLGGVVCGYHAKRVPCGARTLKGNPCKNHRLVGRPGCAQHWSGGVLA